MDVWEVWSIMMGAEGNMCECATWDALMYDDVMMFTSYDDVCYSV